MYVLVCPNCNDADIEKIDKSDNYFCHCCDKECKKEELKVITIDEYLGKSVLF